jgi:hypothetical protein
MLYYQSIDSTALELLKELMAIPQFNELFLVGGTSLALQIGHRKSIDLELFGKFNTDKREFAWILKKFDSVKLINETQNIKTYTIENIKVDFINYPYSWIDKIILKDGIRLAGLKDIAAMKLSAITGRGTKKDFIDLYFLLRYFGLNQMLNFYIQKYPDGSKFLVLKSLTYFEDAEVELAPVMLESIDWEEVKSKIVKETRSLIN